MPLPLLTLIAEWRICNSTKWDLNEAAAQQLKAENFLSVFTWNSEKKVFEKKLKNFMTCDLIYLFICVRFDKGP